MTDFLEAEGCKTKTERGKRAFPLSDHASDITRALEQSLKRNGARIELNTSVISVETGYTVNDTEDRSSDTNKKRFKIKAQKKDGKTVLYRADCVIIATGGLSYPSTGATGDGYGFAESLGISVRTPVPALVPLVTNGICDEQKKLQGVSLKNVSISILDTEEKKLLYESETGELLFTHFGLSGPLVLSVSSLISSGIKAENKYSLSIDLKPALSEKQLDERILRDFESSTNMNIENALSKLLISSLRPVILKRCGIDEKKKVRDITREERLKIVECIKGFSFDITGTRGFDEAIITQGGINIKELNPKTLEAKKCKGLYFAGEVIDVDAYTGGFNLQIAWSTGHAAGMAAAVKEV